MRIATIFENLESVHWTKDVGMFAAALAKTSGQGTESIIYYKGEKSINPPDSMSQYVKSIRINASSRFMFLVRVIVDLVCNRTHAVTLYHICLTTIILTLLLKILGIRVYIKLDMNLLSARNLVNLWDNILRPSSLFVKFVLSMADCITCETEEVYYLLKKYAWASRNLHLVPNCILKETIPVEPRKLTERNNSIVFVGRLGATEKNAEAVLKALSAIPIGHFTWTLIFCGTATTEFQQMVNHLISQRKDLVGRIVMAGNLDRNSLFEVLSRAKVFLMTSRFEGFSLAALEAAWMGCYIMGTPVGGLSELTDRWRLGHMLAQDDLTGLSVALTDVCLEKDDAVNQLNTRLAFVHKNFDIQQAAQIICRALKITQVYA